MEKVVCVTGASGYIASWLVKLLLERGYTVKASVRNLSDPTKVTHLMALEGADKRLHLYEANLMDEGSFDSVVDDCECVFHTASPILLSVTDPQRELIDPAVNGTINVLKSCKKASSTKRVVITSSMAAVAYNHNTLKSSVIVDETWFSDPIFCEQIKQWYALSKTLAEEVAWKFAKENGLELVTLHPGYVTGPLLQPTLNLTSGLLLNLIKQETQLEPNGVCRFVDVRDVALAHIVAFENSSASGRYCLVERVAYWSEIMDILKMTFPSLNLPSSSGENRHTNPPYEVSKERAESLGISFTSLELSLKDTVESLKQKNFLGF